MGGGRVSDDSDTCTGLSMLGEIAWLMAHSPLHRSWPLESLLQWVAPALALKQCRAYHRSNKPVAYVSWAWLSKDAEEAYVLNPRSLTPANWKSGQRLWIIDLIAPFGDGGAVMRDLKTGLFRNAVLRALRVKPGTDQMRIIYLHGIDAAADARDEARHPAVDLEGAVLRRARA